MEKIFYSEPAIEICEIEKEDVISTSDIITPPHYFPTTTSETDAL